ncbi:MAG TPA: hypothetical protein VLG49_05605 [Rhabdochlamydiaceae bacterium]|nr:hypothetical protein [Rhabdochlamydiaceae bacterium]
MNKSKSAIAVLSIFLLSSQAYAYLLDDVMSKDEQHLTGVYYLTHNQRAELEAWLNQNFDLKPKPSPREIPKEELTLAENINNGHQLRLSDGSVYQIAPADVPRASGWITPFPIQIVPSGDMDYPFKIVNKNTGSSLKAKLISAPTS